MRSPAPTISDTAPYAPPATLVSVIERFRDTGFAGQPITVDALARASVSESLRPRTLASLRQLGLVDEDDRPTELFEGLKRAPAAEFRDRVAEWLEGVYAPVIGFFDPATATVEQVEDAFRGYKPEGQRQRMATLFIGLAEYAGLREAESPRRKVRIVRGSAKGKLGATGSAKGRAARPAGAGGAADPPPPPAESDGNGVSGARERYVDMLLKRADKAEDLDPELLDRIERALGIASSKESDP